MTLYAVLKGHGTEDVSLMPATVTSSKDGARASFLLLREMARAADGLLGRDAPHFVFVAFEARVIEEGGPA